MIEQALPTGLASSPASSTPPWVAALSDATPDGLSRLRRLAARLAGHPDALDLLSDIDAIARELSDRQGMTDRLAFLAEAAELLHAAGEVEPTLARVARLVVPRLADTCTVYLLDERGEARHVASEHADSRRQALLETAASLYVPRPGGRRPPAVALERGHPVLFEDVAADLFTEAMEPEMQVRLGPLTPTSWIAVPLTVRGRTAGVISLTVAGARQYGAADLELASELAERISLSVENRLLLRQAEDTRAQLDTLFRSTPVALALFDRELRYLRVNDAAASLLGRRPEALVGRSVRDVDPHMWAHLESAGRRLMNSARATLTTELTGTPPGLTQAGHWLVTLYPVRAPGGRCIGLGAAVVDITARKQAELAAQAAKEAAEAASLAKSQFLAVMSHELRTPLTTVIGYADLLVGETSGPLNPRQREQLSRIKTSAWHLVSIIEEILTFTRADAGKERVTPDRTDVVALVREAAATVEPQATARGLVFRTVGLEGFRPVVTDAGKIRQILLNLLGNAVKFTERGSVELELAGGAGGAGAAGGVTVYVRDTGPGIAAADLESIFEPFRQVDQSNTRENGGTGLGLTISRKLARLLGGDVTVASEPGVGSAFTLWVPASPARQSAASTSTVAVPSGV